MTLSDSHTPRFPTISVQSISKLNTMALSQAEWSFDSIPVTIPPVSDATFMLSDGGSNAMSSQLPPPTDAMPQSPELPEEVWMQILGLVSHSTHLQHAQRLT